jgi:hypothetical protein
MSDHVISLILDAVHVVHMIADRWHGGVWHPPTSQFWASLILVLPTSWMKMYEFGTTCNGINTLLHFMRSWSAILEWLCSRTCSLYGHNRWRCSLGWKWWQTDRQPSMVKDQGCPSTAKAKAWLLKVRMGIRAWERRPGRWGVIAHSLGGWCLETSTGGDVISFLMCVISTVNYCFLKLG